MNRLGFVFTTLLLALALASSMLFVVDQRQFGIRYALGQIKEVIIEPGLNSLTHLQDLLGQLIVRLHLHQYSQALLIERSVWQNVRLLIANALNPVLNAS